MQAAPTLAPDAEQTIAAALRGGDKERALQLMMDAYGGELYRYCLRMIGDAPAAQEVHQETFTQAYFGLDRLRGDGKIKGWLYAIANHRCLDAIRVARRQAKRFLLVDEPPDRPAADPEPGDKLLERERDRSLWDCVRRLPAVQRIAVALRFVEGLSYPEMAARLGDEPPTLRKRVVRALPQLRRCLVARGVSL